MYGSMSKSRSGDGRSLKDQLWDKVTGRGSSSMPYSRVPMDDALEGSELVSDHPRGMEASPAAKRPESVFMTRPPRDTWHNRSRSVRLFYAFTVVLSAVVLLLVAGRRGALTGGAHRRGGRSGTSGGLSSPSIVLSGSGDSLPPRPHVIVFYVDDQGMGDVGYLGSKLRTPTIDAMARDGLRLANYYSAHTCTPARGALLTGLYPHHLGLQKGAISAQSPWGMRTDAKTLAQYLREVGYKTHMVGKWNLGHASKALLPTWRGFDSFYGFFTGAIRYFDHGVRDRSDEALVNVTDLAKSQGRSLSFVQGDNHTLATHLFQQEAVRVIESHNPRTPLFLYVSLPNVHRPLANLSRQGYFTKEQESYLDSIPSRLRRLFAMSSLVLDEAVRHVMVALDRAKLLDDAIVLYASDNGGCYRSGGLNGPYRGTKHSLFEGGVRAPAFLWSRRLARELRGREYPHPFHVTDVLPTLLAAVGHDLRPDRTCVEATRAGEPAAAGVDCLDGHNHWPTMMGEVRQGPRSEVLLHYDPYVNDKDEGKPAEGRTQLEEVSRLGEARAGLRVGEYKLLLNEWDVNATAYDEQDMGPQLFVDKQPDCMTLRQGAERKTLLFDLSRDPYEQVDISRERPLLVDEMMTLLYSYAVTNVPSSWKPPDQEAKARFASKAGGFVCPWLDRDMSYMTPPTKPTTPHR